MLNKKTKKILKNGEIGKRYFVVKDSIFNRRIHIFLNHTYKDFDRWTKRKGYNQEGKEIVNYDDNFAGFSTYMDGENQPTEWIICIKNFNWSIGSQGSLLHEIVHSIIKIWKFNNISFGEDTQEFLAHSIANLYEDICGKIFGLKKIKKDKVKST